VTTATTTCCQAENITLLRGTPDTQITVLDGIDFAAHAGEVVCLQGRSGSGKTSLLHIIAGLLRPTTGSVDVAGAAVWTLPPDERARLRRTAMSLVIQEGGLIDSLTVTENLLLALDPAETRAERRELAGRCHAALDTVGLAGRGTSSPRQLSTGERQRVAFARVLLAPRPLVLVDEPTASLDRASAERVITSLADLVAGGDAACIVASHDQAVVEAAHRVIPLHG
jgi:ABC-type lipoprotein export system ATPase subunit